MNFEYWIAGKGPEEFELKQQVENLKLQKKIKFLGYVDDIPTLKKKQIFF